MPSARLGLRTQGGDAGEAGLGAPPGRQVWPARAGSRRALGGAARRGGPGPPERRGPRQTIERAQGGPAGAQRDGGAERARRTGRRLSPPVRAQAPRRRTAPGAAPRWVLVAWSQPTRAQAQQSSPA
ncbi:MAG: hypothetical protein EXR47_01420 [Dehalococcoidia bacterium]|nr:hypothetical protein [Dehalococcoidia bacterium]